MITFRPTCDTSANPKGKQPQGKERKQTFWSKRNTNSVCKHVDAFEDARAALIRKLNFLVSATGENGAGSLRRSTTERARRAGGDVVHGVGMCRGGREERREVGGEKEVGREKRKKGNTRQSGPFIFVPLFGSFYVRIKKSLTPSRPLFEHFVASILTQGQSIKACINTTSRYYWYGLLL